MKTSQKNSDIHFKKSNAYILLFLFLIFSIFDIGLSFKSNQSLLKNIEWVNNLQNYKKSLVRIYSIPVVPFIGDYNNKIICSGVIVDKEEGLIITIKKAARLGISEIFAEMYDGTILVVNQIYTDLNEPFGILKIRNFSDEIKEKINEFKIEANIRNNNNIRDDEEVLMVDNEFKKPFNEYNLHELKKSEKTFIFDTYLDDIKNNVTKQSDIKNTKNISKQIKINKDHSMLQTANYTIQNKNKRNKNIRIYNRLISSKYVNLLNMRDKISSNSSETNYKIKKQIKEDYKNSSINLFRKIRDDKVELNYIILKLTSVNSIYANKLSCLLKAKKFDSNQYDVKKKKIRNRLEKKYKKGSALISKDNRLIGLLLINSEEQYIFINLDTVSFLLDNYKSNKKFSRNNMPKIINLDFSLIPFGVATNSYNLNNRFYHKYIQKHVVKSDRKETLLLINSSSQMKNDETDEENDLFVIKPGDILYKLNNEIVGNDILKVNRILIDNNEKQILPIHIIRNGRIFEKRINLYDQEKFKIKKFIKVSHSFFYELNIFEKQEFNHKKNRIDGIYMTYYESDSPFSNYVLKNRNRKSNFILSAINSFPIRNLPDLKNILLNNLNCNYEQIYFEGYDLNYYTNNHIIHSMNLKVNKDEDDILYDMRDLMYYEYFYDENLFNWKIKETNLNRFCIDRSNLPVVNLNKTEYNPFPATKNYDPLLDDGLPFEN